MFKAEDLRPCGQWTVIERNEREEKTHQGVALPMNRGERNFLCKIIKLGPGKTYERRDGTRFTIPATLVCKEGDTVITRQFEGRAVGSVHKDLKNVLICNGAAIEGRVIKE